MEMYWRMQWRRINRHLVDFGLHPAAGYLLLILVFIGFSVYLFYRVQYAAYIYAFLALSLVTLTSASERVLFLKQHFTTPIFRKIRVAENLILILPFALVLLLLREWIVATGVIGVSLLLALSSFEQKMHFTIPTPFYRYPFEFATGFRKNLSIICIAVFLQVMGVVHHNGNLTLFALGLILFVCISFYLPPENQYLVWIHGMTPRYFLWHKIRIALLYSSLLCLPFMLVQAIFFPSVFGVSLSVYMLGLLFIMATLLGKYAFYPAPVNLPQGITLAISFSFPPLLLFLIPYFYRRAVRQLKPVLE